MYEITEVTTRDGKIKYKVPTGGTWDTTYADRAEAEKHLALLNALPPGSYVTKRRREEKSIFAGVEGKIHESWLTCGPRIEGEKRFDVLWGLRVPVDKVVEAYRAHTEEQAAKHEAEQREAAEREAKRKARKKPHGGKPRTYKCRGCERRRPIEDQMDSVINGDPVCGDCWDDTE